MNPAVYFWLFLKASLFSTSGLGNLPILHQDLLARGWATEADFVQAIAVGRLSPGPSGLWAISLGYLTYGWPGALLALMAITLPPLLILGVAALHRRFEEKPVVQHFTQGLGMGVVGLILAVTWTLLNTTVSDWRGLAIVAGAFGLTLSRRVPVIVLLGIAALAGWLLYGLPG
ncbi:MAG: chromate transporter [Chloroflexi bacterium]|nr:chromate transporter [Chloroflexota bacterium]